MLCPRVFAATVLPGTDSGYGTTSFEREVIERESDETEDGKRVRKWHKIQVLRAPYATSGTELVYAASCLVLSWGVLLSSQYRLSVCCYVSDTVSRVVVSVYARAMRCVGLLACI